ncbi:AI-2E family transporter [Sphingobacterium alkalisoli]|uniref:AI-2E family transporter n=1 Tax=Sphingobacterium alkalisoli TaxID=1874115 RepID=A0A4U0GQV4_9SPHI|nr:AI-2E family transporter [Sphingobacterium alkalisoli]TJY61330.1 AI-2E family transporter [Sphingobacterium alkalisoli]GGH30921.1 AI-2E family transporter [Sphingobacterium alkalisoli]
MNNAVFSQKERNIIILIIVLFLGAILMYALKGIFSAILGTMVMYTLFRNLNRFLIENWHWPKPLSSVFIIIISLFIIVLPFVGIGSMLLNKARELQDNPDWINSIIDAINTFVGDKLGKPDFLKEQLEASAAYAGELLTAVLGMAANIFLEISVMYFILYFLFVNYKGFENGIVFYMPFDAENAVEFGNELKNITYSNIVGQTFIAIVQGGCLALGFWIFDVSDPLFWGVICAILSFIPLIGPPLIFVPAAMILFAEGQSWQAVGLLLWGFGLVINIDNVLRLIIAKKIGDIHPIITVVGVIIGLPLFGIMGLVYGPLLLAYFLIAVKIYKANKRLALKRDQLEQH